MSDEPRSTKQDEDPEVEAHARRLTDDEGDEPEVEAHSMRPSPAEQKARKTNRSDDAERPY
jgi:hypothetical protein